jgi:FAD-dependent monooxygenase
MEHKLPHGTVLIAGGGPIGLTLARVLAHYDVPSILFERNNSTTDWPKMDLTNARSMELFRMLGLADALRAQGVPAHFDQDVLISTGMGSSEILTKWDLPGVEKFRARIRECNDGSMPLEPYQRMSQAVFERWLKGVCEGEPLIQLRYGCRVEGVVEEGDCVKTTVVEVETGKTEVYVSDYVAGCDGASSRVRKSFDIPVDGGPM